MEIKNHAIPKRDLSGKWTMTTFTGRDRRETFRGGWLPRSVYKVAVHQEAAIVLLAMAEGAQSTRVGVLLSETTDQRMEEKEGLARSVSMTVDMSIRRE